MDLDSDKNYSTRTDKEWELADKVSNLHSSPPQLMKLILILA